MQLAHHDVAVLLALRQLRTLDLGKSRMDEPDIHLTSAAREAAWAAVDHMQCAPPLWTLRSLQNTARLSASVMKEHGHELDVRMDIFDSDGEDYSDGYEEYSDSKEYSDEAGAE